MNSALSDESAAKSAALTTTDPELLQVIQSWPDLAALVAAWPTLPDHIRAAIRALVGTVAADRIKGTIPGSV